MVSLRSPCLEPNQVRSAGRDHWFQYGARSARTGRHTHDAAHFFRCKPFIAAHRWRKTEKTRENVSSALHISWDQSDCGAAGQWIAVDGAQTEWLRYGPKNDADRDQFLRDWFKVAMTEGADERERQARRPQSPGGDGPAPCRRLSANMAPFWAIDKANKHDEDQPGARQAQGGPVRLEIPAPTSSRCSTARPNSSRTESSERRSLILVNPGLAPKPRLGQHDVHRLPPERSATRSCRRTGIRRTPSASA